MPTMTTIPDRRRVPLPGISSRAYEHPADRSALVAMRSLSGFDSVLKQLSGLVSERRLRLMRLASAVRTSDTQFRSLHEMGRDAAYILDLPRIPEIYVQQDPSVNAMAIGFDDPFIVVTTGTLDLLDEEELRFVIGHETAHILSGHAVYRTMLLILTRLATRVAWIPLGYIGLRAIVAGLEEWFRKSELSCDRGGLLCGQDPDAAMRALMKLAGGTRLHEMNIEAFLDQAREYDTAGDVRDGLLKVLNLLGTTHPFAVVRVAELDRWRRSGAYEAILSGDYPRREDDRNVRISEEIKEAARAYRESWSQSQDPFIGVLRDVAESAVSAGERIFNRFARRTG
ncbi:Zn-dependent protease with chaperone function [Thermopolyspora flexuosa]|jgi:Zn-dependent protease with chaperone function|uniref:Zn-dependent protease with chaperone function n=2 Tax=Thermopolyspora flexuosa TaxID=103836 RepID=A0A543IV76_9ACTN|nr:Zn-dependent protease with chaperone function [Thermopolyspora flexuosa]